MPIIDSKIHRSVSIISTTTHHRSLLSKLQMWKAAQQVLLASRHSLRVTAPAVTTTVAVCMLGSAAGIVANNNEDILSQQFRHFHSNSVTALEATPPSHKRHAEAPPPPPQQQQQQSQQDTKKACPVYGCPYFPQDIYYDPPVKKALAELRQLPRKAFVPDDKGHVAQPKSLQILNTSGRTDAATLTLIGYKGGPLETQINQDRALLIAPYSIIPSHVTVSQSETGSSSSSSKSRMPWSRRSIATTTTTTTTATNSDTTNASIPCRILGVFDGHANYGERVSQYVVDHLPKMLAKKLKYTNNQLISRDAIIQALQETFVELDHQVPADVSGGCTASVVLQYDQNVYFANAGDSRSFLVVYRPTFKKHHEADDDAKKLQIVYMTREDKPDLPDERARVESRGGEVYLPVRGTSRVLYTDPLTGMQSGLAMSRSIGDWEVGKFGVIPDPIVDVIHIPELVASQMKIQSEDDGPAVDDVYIFAVSATDGMMDFISPHAIGHALALSLFENEDNDDDDNDNDNNSDEAKAPHLLTTLEQLIYIAAQRWEQSKQGRYRDDIAIAVSQIRIPPSASKNAAADANSNKKARKQ